MHTAGIWDPILDNYHFPKNQLTKLAHLVQFDKLTYA